MKKIYFIVTIGLLLLFSSCADLDLNPLSEASTENWYSTEEQLEMSVNSLYYINFWRVDEDLWTDDWMDRNTLTPITGATMTSEFPYATNTWSLAYQAIATATTLIAKMESMDGEILKDKLDRYRGEAHFVRAYQYSVLISHFGDVIYYENTPDIDEAYTLSKTSKDVVLQKIYEDFDRAASLLPLQHSGTETSRATKGAALALKSRIALYMHDYQTAKDAAKACIDLDIYQLNPDFEELFLTKNAQESIFLIPRSVAQGIYFRGSASTEVLSGERFHPFSVQHYLPRNNNGFIQNAPSWDLFCSYLCMDGLPIDESPLFNPRDPFKNRDPRCSATIVEFGTRHLDISYQPHPDSLNVYNYVTNSLIRNNDCLTNAEYASNNGLAWKKWIDNSWTNFTADPDKIIIRYADVLLMYAEAKIELNEIDQSVVDAINQVRARAYKVAPSETSLYPAVIAGNQNELRKIVRIERRMEFANEGLRYMDIIRWRLAEKVLNKNNYGILLPIADLRNKVVKPGLWFFPSTPEIDEDGIANFDPLFEQGLIRLVTVRRFDETRQYLWPIPSKEVKINPNLKQNPNY
ncbi:MAG: RagB/SusD family nutrient uptake outer membrane protein [Parabacteroides sp.]|nr:RagB/SusD family nutrient uptake outer membrane protein [Parabacteroides sp.]